MNHQYSDYLPRLYYLAAELNIPIPSTLQRLLPQGEVLASVAKMGISGTAVNFQINPNQLISLYNQGKEMGSNQVFPDEYRTLIGYAATITLDQETELDFQEKAAYFKAISAFMENKSEALVPTENASLATATGAEIIKWDSGFTPWDLITGGFYQGIVTVLGRTGHGKTSLMLAMMIEMKRKNPDMEMRFYESEIPMGLMLHKMRHRKDEAGFSEQDRMLTGYLDIQDIATFAKDYPNPKRAIFIDSPDVMAGGIGEGRRFALADLYRKLMFIKENSGIVVVSSQAKRNVRGILTAESVTEAWEKSHYSDVIIGVEKQTVDPTSPWTPVLSNIAKNRFGPWGNQVTFDFNYDTLEWRQTENMNQGGGDDDGW